LHSKRTWKTAAATNADNYRKHQHNDNKKLYALPDCQPVGIIVYGLGKRWEQNFAIRASAKKYDSPSLQPREKLI